MISSEWYRSFLAIYRSGTVSAAALERFLTQPAVTQHLAGLEAVVGEALFVRTPRKMIPTERGKELYAQVADALDQLDAVSRKYEGKTGEPRILRLGAPREFFQEVGLARLASVDFQLRLRFGLQDELAAALEHGDIDLAILTGRTDKRGIEVISFFTERFVLVGTHTFLFDTTGLSEVSMASYLAQLPWIAYSVELPIVRRFWQITFGKHPPFLPACVLPDLRLIRDAVLLNRGVSLLPDYMVEDLLANGTLCELWQPGTPVTNELYLAWRRGSKLCPVGNEARRLLSVRA